MPAPATQTAPAIPSSRLLAALSPPLLALLVALVTAALALSTMPRVLDRLTPATGDEPFYLMTAGALWEDGTFDEARQWQIEAWRRFYPLEPQPSDFRGWPAYPEPLPPHFTQTIRPPGEQYSKHGPGVPLLIAPAYGLFGRPGALAVYALLAGLLAAQIFLLAWEAGGSRSAALLVWAALSLSSPLFSYTLAIFPALPAALLTVFAYRSLRRWPEAGPLRRAATGAALGFLPLLHTLFVLLTLPFAVRLIWRDAAMRAPLGRSLAWTAPLSLGAALLLSYHFSLYGGPWPNFQDHAGFNLPDFTSAAALRDSVGAMLGGVAGVLLDGQWGLLIYAPVYLAAAAGLVVAARRRSPHLEALALALPYCLAVALYRQWWGEWCPPARYLAPVAPLAAAPLALLLTGAAARRALPLVAALALPGGLMMALMLNDPQAMFQHPTRESKPLAVAAERWPALRDLRLHAALPSFIPQQPYLPDRPIPLGRNLAWTFGALACALAAGIWAARPEPPVPAAGWDIKHRNKKVASPPQERDSQRDEA